MDESPGNLAPLILKKGEERRLLAGHSWIYSNEIDTARSPLKAHVPGQPAAADADRQAMPTASTQPLMRAISTPRAPSLPDPAHASPSALRRQHAL